MGHFLDGEQENSQGDGANGKFYTELGYSYGSESTLEPSPTPHPHTKKNPNSGRARKRSRRWNFLPRVGASRTIYLEPESEQRSKTTPETGIIQNFPGSISLVTLNFQQTRLMHTSKYGRFGFCVHIAPGDHKIHKSPRTRSRLTTAA